MGTECHSVAGRIITKAFSKSPWRAGLIYTDIGSDDRLARQNPQIHTHASNRTSSHHVLCSRHSTSQRTSTATRLRQTAPPPKCKPAARVS
eukprot:1143959-Pelagomonas_calceolata.AAC.2